jgi:hypothetical protein
MRVGAPCCSCLTQSLGTFSTCGCLHELTTTGALLSMPLQWMQRLVPLAAAWSCLRCRSDDAAAGGGRGTDEAHPQAAALLPSRCKTKVARLQSDEPVFLMRCAPVCGTAGIELRSPALMTRGWRSCGAHCAWTLQALRRRSGQSASQRSATHCAQPSTRCAGASASRLWRPAAAAHCGVVPPCIRPCKGSMAPNLPPLLPARRWAS